MTTRKVAKRIVVTPIVESTELCYDIQSFGLCNQIFSIGCALADGIHYKKNICIRGFCPEMTSKNILSIERLLNVGETNQNLVGTKIVVTKPDARLQFVKGEMFAKTEWQQKYQELCIKALVFSKEIINIANQLTGNENYYCVHFRFDIDCIVFLSGIAIYHEWITLTDAKREKEARQLAEKQIEKHRPWIEAKLQNYINNVQKFFVDENVKIVVLTSIGKNVMLNQNDLVEWIYKDFEKALHSRVLHRNTNFASPGREYSAAVELNIACNPKCVGFIGCSGSTFSATIKMRIDPKKHLSVV